MRKIGLTGATGAGNSGLDVAQNAEGSSQRSGTAPSLDGQVARGNPGAGALQITANAGMTGAPRIGAMPDGAPSTPTGRAARGAETPPSTSPLQPTIAPKAHAAPQAAIADPGSHSDARPEAEIERHLPIIGSPNALQQSQSLKAGQMRLPEPLQTTPPPVDHIERDDRGERPNLTEPTPPTGRDARFTTPPISVPAPTFGTQIAPVQGSFTQGLQATIDFDANLDPLQGLQSPISTGSAVAVASAAMPFNAPSNAPTLMAQQIAAALQDRSAEPGQPIELALDPPELGRVRLHMAEIAGVLTLTIHAERPETAELMRRHLDLLAQEFSEAGVDAPSVRVSQEDAGENSHADRGGNGEAAADAAPPDPDLNHPKISPADPSGALDLRL